MTLGELAGDLGATYKALSNKVKIAVVAGVVAVSFTGLSADDVNTSKIAEQTISYSKLSDTEIDCLTIKSNTYFKNITKDANGFTEAAKKSCLTGSKLK